MTSKRDYYEVLGVPKDADDKTIKKAYKKKAMQYHPDRYKGDKAEAEEKFKELNEAYSILSDPEQRKIYDQFGHDGLDPRKRQAAYSTNPFDFISQIFGFDDIFGGFGGSSRSRQKRGPSRGRDAVLNLNLSYEEAYSGVTKKVKAPFKKACPTCSGSGAKPGEGYTACSKCRGHGVIEHRQQTLFGWQITQQACDRCGGRGEVPKSTCRTCKGTGKTKERETLSVNIPAGIDEGEMVRVRGKGYPSSNGGLPGDLLFHISLKPHAQFERQGLDVYMRLLVPFDVVALGGEIKVPVIGPPGENRTERLSIRAGTQVGDFVKLPGKGYRRSSGGQTRSGDMIYAIQIEVPKRLNREQKKALELFRQASKR